MNLSAEVFVTCLNKISGPLISAPKEVLSKVLLAQKISKTQCNIIFFIIYFNAMPMHSITYIDSDKRNKQNVMKCAETACYKHFPGCLNS